MLSLGQESGCFGAIAVALQWGAVGEAEVWRTGGVGAVVVAAAAVWVVLPVRGDGGGGEEEECVDAVE